MGDRTCTRKGNGRSSHGISFAVKWRVVCRFENKLWVPRSCESIGVVKTHFHLDRVP